MDGIIDDLGYGILKPIKDACASIVSTILISTFTDFASKYTNQVFGLSFNIVTFTFLFVFISYFDDLASMMIYDSTKYFEPFDEGLRLFGIVIGMFLFNAPLTLLYALGGGSLGDAIISWIISFVGLIFFTLVRYRFSGY
jgi:multisubunit Na+/H+ antiporter MnhC subunit